MARRFDNVDWYCDRCGAYLNSQPGFDDHKYIWKCQKCGYKSSISKANIINAGGRFRGFGKVLGFLRSGGLYLFLLPIFKGLIARLQGQVSGENKIIFEFLAAYFLLYILSMFYERVLAGYKSDEKIAVWIVKSLFYYLFIDILRPIQEVLGMLWAILSYPKHKMPGYLVRKLIYGIAYLVLISLCSLWTFIK